MKTVRPSVAELQRKHVVLELECIDCMYLNADVPKLTSAAGVAGFFRGYLGHRFASTKDAAAMTDRFITSIRDFLQREDIALVRFQKGQRKDDVFQQRLRRFKAPAGVVFVGVAQEKACVHVMALDAKDNAVIVGTQRELGRRACSARNMHYVSGAQPSEPFRAGAKMRYKARESAVTVYPQGSQARVEFDEPQRDITPGQGLVLFDGEVVIGQGFIE